ENRVIAKVGLELLSRGPHRVGLRALLDVAGLSGKTIDSYHVAFMLAPRVNAAGRMSTPDLATRLLLATGEGVDDEPRGLAVELDGENVRRQAEEADILAGEEDRLDGPGHWCPLGSRGRSRRLAQRCHRDRRVEARRHISPTRDRPLD